MDFKPMDAREYRTLNADQYETRRSLVLSLAEELPVDATEEQMRSIDEEMNYIKAEDSRRDSVTAARNRKALEVIGGAGRVVASTRSAEPAANSLGEHFASYVEERGHEKSFHLVAPAYQTRAAADAHTAPQIADYDKTALVPRANLDVIGLFGREVISGNAITYFVQGAMEGTPAVTAEGTAKPQVHFPNDPKTVALKKIAGIIKESDELIDDAPWLASAINGRLLNELNKVRQATIVADVLATSGIGTANAASGKASDVADAVFAAMMQIQEDTGFEADGIIMTPALWETLNTGKNDTSDYYGEGYFRAPMARSIWGIPVALSSTLTAGHILVGAFRTCGSLVTKAEGVTVESTNTDADDFQKNLMTMRAEVREVAILRQPAGVVNITVA